MNALIVDDSSAMRAFLARILKAQGFETAQAQDGEVALKTLDAGLCPDLILLDWNMPVKDGLQTLIAIRTRYSLRNVPVVMVTTEIELSDVERALAAGASEYVMKPFTPAVISDKLQLLGFAVAAG
jgi:two-component system, chemotaxis family, chemotaxis protein CheY